jgi:hypothetical protein
MTVGYLAVHEDDALIGHGIAAQKGQHVCQRTFLHHWLHILTQNNNNI